MELRPLPFRFIDEPIEVDFDQPPLLEKDPPCPNGITWDGKHYRVLELLAEWRDFQRRGKMGRNMRPEHAARARIRGSWGVGRYYFRVRVNGGRIFEVYYDRSPGNVDDRKGRWVLYGERNEE